MCNEVTSEVVSTMAIVDPQAEFLISPEHLLRFFGKDKIQVPIFFTPEDCEDPVKIKHDGIFKVSECGPRTMRQKYIVLHPAHLPKNLSATLLINGSRHDEFEEGLPIPIVPTHHNKAKSITINLGELKAVIDSNLLVSVCRRRN